MYSKEANIKIKVWGGPCSGVLLDSGRRQLWRESQKSLCMKIREFELYLPCQGRPLKDITGQWHDQMVNRSSKELFWRSGRKCTRKCDTWKENKPLERWKSPNVCVLVSFARNQSTWLADVIFFFAAQDVERLTRTCPSLFGHSMSLHILLRPEEFRYNQYHWGFLTGTCHEKRLII